MKDYSKLAKDSMWPTSQEAGNMMSGTQDAMTAPGSQPVHVMNPRVNQMITNQRVEDSNAKQIPPGTSGKPQASEQVVRTGRVQQGPPRWTRTSEPEVVRDDSAETAHREVFQDGTVQRPRATDAGRQRG